MRILKHGFLSLIRKPAKVIMIFSILFVVFSLLFTGVIIQNGIGESKKFIRRQLGAAVEYKVNYQKAYEQELEDEEYSKIDLSMSVAEEIAKDSVVKSVNFTNSYGLASSKLMTAEYWERDGVKEYQDYSYEDENGNEVKEPIYVELQGQNITEPIEFSEGNLYLVEGEFPTQEQVNEGERYVLITLEFAERNNLGIGDFFELNEIKWDYESSEMKEGKAYEFEVIGIYDGIQDGYRANQMYVSFEFNRRLREELFIEEDIEVDLDSMVDRIIYILNDPLEVDGFIERNTPLLPSEFNYFDAGKSQYDTLTKPLDLISFITTLLIWVVFGAGIIIIIAIVSIFVRDRKFEVGLLLSSGESKLRIVTQFVYEILCIGLIAFVLAVGVSSLASNYASDWIVENQLLEEESMSEDSYYYGGWGEDIFGSVDMNNVAEDFQVGLDGKTILQLFIINIALLIFAGLVPLTVIMMFNPRQVLQD